MIPPSVVFVISLVTTLVLVITVALVYDRTPDTRKQKRSSHPFPNVAPLVAGPPTKDVCVNLMSDASGHYVPSPKDPLKTCTTDFDCADCGSSPVDVPVECRAPSASVAQQQHDLKNSADKYCLPRAQSCMPDLHACTHDGDCAVCDDVLGGGEAMRCEIVSDPKVVGDVDVPVGNWCLPRTGKCDAENASLQWTSDGWKCTCKFPTVHGGEACDLPLTCSTSDVTDWSADKQRLMINEDTDEPEAWTMKSGVNPVLCHVEGATRSEWDKPCTKDTIPNTVCRCDGLAKDSLTGYRNDPNNPMVCVPDTCSMNAYGGRANEPMEMKEWAPGLPPNHCVCSGRDSRIWRPGKDEDDPEVVTTQDGWVYTGRCEDTTIATRGGVVKLRAGEEHAASEECAREPNQHAEITSLVPGFGVNENGDANVSVCSPDPCRAHYSDINFRPPDDLQSLGHFNSDMGKCECSGHHRSVDVDTEVTVNPVGSVCVDACASNPCKQHPDRPCPTDPVCTTGADGQAICTAPTGCGMVDKFTCARQFNIHESCSGYTNVPNICKDVDGVPARCACHNGRRRVSALGGCRSTDEKYSMCTIDTSEFPTCHTGKTHGISKCGGDHNPKCTGPKGCTRTSRSN